MQSSIADKILAYPDQVLGRRQKFLKRNSFQDFKQIPMSQIQMEFKVLSSASFYDEEKTLYTKNTKYNRYIDILTYQHSRVKYDSHEDYYCNACHMKSIVDGKDFAIFSQAPTPTGVQQFWLAVYQHNIKQIVMLCDFYDPRRGQQSQQYWPALNIQTQLKKVALTLQTIHQQKQATDCTISQFILKGPQGQKSVKHVHWTGWSDLKKPLGNQNQNLFRALVKECLNLTVKNQMFLIHCSAGIGRTGTLGTMIQAIRCMEKFKQISIFEIVENLRKHRMYCVQTFEQYSFIYQELRNYLSK